MAALRLSQNHSQKKHPGLEASGCAFGLSGDDELLENQIQQTVG